MNKQWHNVMMFRIIIIMTVKKCYAAVLKRVTSVESAASNMKKNRLRVYKYN